MERLFDASVYIGRWPALTDHVPDCSALLTMMDRLGIERAIVNHSLSWQYSPKFGNSALMEEIRDNPRLEPCWGVTPGASIDLYGGYEGFEKELEINSIRAVRLFPRDHVFSLGDWMTEKTFKIFDRRKMVVFIDLDQVFLQSGMYDYDANGLDRIDYLSKKYPGISFILTRVGYRAYQSIINLLSNSSNLHIDLSFLGTHLGVEDIVKRFGCEKIVFGTSYPLVDPGGALARLQFSGLNADEKSRIGSTNLENLLNRVVNYKDPVDLPSPTYPLYNSLNIEVTDAHCHLGQYYKFAIPNPDLKGMIEVMDASGVARACISSHLAITSDWELGNKLTLEARDQFPDRFIGQVVVSPVEPHCIKKEITKYIDHLGFKAIKVVPDTHLKAITSKEYEPMWEAAAERNCLVLSHTFHGSNMDSPSLFAELAEKYPSVPILIVHSGALTAGFPEAIRIAKSYPNLYLDVSGSYITGPWIKNMVEDLGPEKVVFSSDMPFIDLRYSLGRVLYSGLSPNDIKLVLGGNIRRLLNLG
jgi:predicted TIM-barrel fold metal-dependent hydrolase